MAPRMRKRPVARIGRTIVLAVFAIGVAACAAVLGIDDREPVEDGVQSEGGTTDGNVDGGGMAEGATDALLDDGGADAPDPSKQCVPAACSAAGGSCINGSCALACGAACNGKTFVCPPDNDCTVGCTTMDSCNAVKCVGGRSCTLDCSGIGSCKMGVACESERCNILCKGPKDACRDGVVTCDASVCNVVCSGPDSCNKGAAGTGSTYCGVTCTGVPSCSGAMASLRCNAPDASIFCGVGKDICKDNKLFCDGDFCVIACNEPAKCAGKDYCCDSTTCAFDAAPLGNNDCP